MAETADKVNEGNAPRGEMGQRYLVSSEPVSMRLWDGEESGEKPKPEAQRPYETVGYVIEGRAAAGGRDHTARRKLTSVLLEPAHGLRHLALPTVGRLVAHTAPSSRLRNPVPYLEERCTTRPP